MPKKTEDYDLCARSIFGTKHTKCTGFQMKVNHYMYLHLDCYDCPHLEEGTRKEFEVEENELEE